MNGSYILTHARLLSMGRPPKFNLPRASGMLRLALSGTLNLQANGDSEVWVRYDRRKLNLNDKIVLHCGETSTYNLLRSWLRSSSQLLMIWFQHFCMKMLHVYSWRWLCLNDTLLGKVRMSVKYQWKSAGIKDCVVYLPLPLSLLLHMEKILATSFTNKKTSASICLTALWNPS